MFIHRITDSDKDFIIKCATITSVQGWDTFRLTDYVEQCRGFQNSKITIPEVCLHNVFLIFGKVCNSCMKYCTAKEIKLIKLVKYLPNKKNPAKWERLNLNSFIFIMEGFVHPKLDVTVDRGFHNKQLKTM